MSRIAHFSFVAVEYKQYLIDAGYITTENETFPNLCLVEAKYGLESLLQTLQEVAHNVDADLFIIDKHLPVAEGLNVMQAHEVMWAQALIDKDKLEQAFQEVVTYNAKSGALH